MDRDVTDVTCVKINGMTYKSFTERLESLVREYASQNEVSIAVHVHAKKRATSDEFDGNMQTRYELTTTSEIY